MKTAHHTELAQEHELAQLSLFTLHSRMTRTDLRETHWLPWASANLRRNPFGELSVEERAEVAIVNLDPIVSHVSDRKRAVQFIGACGRGKTTRMLALQRSLPGASYVYLAEQSPCPPIAVGNPVMIDEAQRLPRAVRHAVWRSGLPLILATHRNLERGLRRSGYQVMTIRIGGGNDAKLVHELLNRRIDASRLRPGPVPSLSLDAAHRLVSQFGTNIRAMEHFLYEQLQNEVEQHGEMRSLDCVG